MAILRVRVLSPLIEAYFDPGLQKVVPWAHFGQVGAALPSIRARFSTFAQFGSASISDILGNQASAARELQANWMQTTVFLNRGNHFEARPLPMLAQLSPAFATCVGDLNGDGNEDVFLSQNFFATEGETGRYDSGYGLCLLGDGQGRFKPLLPGQSGFHVYGEQRGAALCDYDQDGRLMSSLLKTPLTRSFTTTLDRSPGCEFGCLGPMAILGASERCYAWAAEMEWDPRTSFMRGRATGRKTVLFPFWLSHLLAPQSRSAGQGDTMSVTRFRKMHARFPLLLTAMFTCSRLNAGKSDQRDTLRTIVQDRISIHNQALGQAGTNRSLQILGKRTTQ